MLHPTALGARFFPPGFAVSASIAGGQAVAVAGHPEQDGGPGAVGTPLFGQGGELAAGQRAGTGLVVVRGVKGQPG
jgi:hypothetical protein